MRRRPNTAYAGAPAPAAPRTAWGTMLLSAMVMTAGSLVVYGAHKMWTNRKKDQKELGAEETELALLKSQLLTSHMAAPAAPSTLVLGGRPSAVILTDDQFRTLYSSAGNSLH